jgi:hypothetical protein
VNIMSDDRFEAKLEVIEDMLGKARAIIDELESASSVETCDEIDLVVDETFRLARCLLELGNECKRVKG